MERRVEEEEDGLVTKEVTEGGRRGCRREKSWKQGRGQSSVDRASHDGHTLTLWTSVGSHGRKWSGGRSWRTIFCPLEGK